MNEKLKLNEEKIILPGGAGHVGQNLVLHLKECGCRNIIVLDKHEKNLNIMRCLHPDIVLECVDLAQTGRWEKHFENASSVVMLQAQMGGIGEVNFRRNSLGSTHNVLSACCIYNVPYIVHVSSSSVKSVATDHYASTKREQELMVINAGLSYIVLRPTLMFGWFDRKHFGWLSRFMKTVPVFPIPGHGRYMRQPLHTADFCRVIISCLESRVSGRQFNISGLEKINYIDIIRHIKKVILSRAVIIKIPFGIFDILLKIWALFDRNPPFTSDQLRAMAGADEFEVIDWPEIFKVQPTPFADAIERTFNGSVYSKIALES